MQAASLKMKRLPAIVSVLLSALTAAGCAVDDAADTQDDQLADPGNLESQDTALPGSRAEVPGLRSTNQPELPSSLPSLKSGITANACRDVVHPELCLVIPFPFCLIPQHECW
jgi:hypothetical protein